MNTILSLDHMGWNHHLRFLSSTHFDLSSDRVLARVASEHRQQYTLMGEFGEVKGVPTGRLRFTADTEEALPKVGDWVLLDLLDEGTMAVIHEVLPRRTCLKRVEAGTRNRPQVIATNIDKAAVVMGLDRDFNPRRLERYLAMIHESGAQPLVALTKADLCHDLDSKKVEIERVAKDLPVHVLSVHQRLGLEAFGTLLTSGRTLALLGSSGVGKSTLVNALLGTERQATREVRKGDNRGRHTTTRRELVPVPGGGLLIDTPGMRELQLWESEEGLSNVFQEIEGLAKACRFSDCTHEHEVGCAVQQALEAGTLPEARFQAYLKLQREQAYLERSNDEHAFRQQQKRLHKMYRKNAKRKR